MAKKQNFWNTKFKVRKTSVSPAQMIFVLGIIMVLVGMVLIAPWVQDKVTAKQTEANYVKEHTEATTNIVPTIVGTTFKINPRAQGTTNIIGRWFLWEGNYEEVTIRWYDPQDTGTGIYIPTISQITNATYATDVAQKISRRDMPGVADIGTLKCWTNNAISDPDKIAGATVKSVEMDLTITLNYENAQGKVDPLGEQSCTLTTTVYYYFKDPGNAPGTFEYAEDYPDTYIYAPFNIRPRYNAVVLEVGGQQQKITYEDDWIGEGYEASNTGITQYTIDEPGRHQPVWYRYPLAYSTDGIISGGVLP